MNPNLVDHTFYVVWAITVCVFTLIFGALHLVAVISAMRKEYRPSQIVMLVCSVIALLSVPACLFGWPWNLDSLLMAVGGGGVCGAAFYNGRSAAEKAGDKSLFHLSHHILRFMFVLILVINFIRI